MCYPNKRGFTLIELLIVVLIIGILAAIAVPQYQFAIDKARLSSYIPVINALSQAQEAYYLEHGAYAMDLRALDVNFEKICPNKYQQNELLNCTGGFKIDSLKWQGTNPGRVTLDYCPGKNNTSGETCRNSKERIVSYFVYLKHHPSAPGACICLTNSTSSRGKKLCQAHILC